MRLSSLCTGYFLLVIVSTREMLRVERFARGMMRKDSVSARVAPPGAVVWGMTTGKGGQESTRTSGHRKKVSDT